MRLRLNDRALRYILLIYFTCIAAVSICYSLLLVELYPVISIPCRMLVTPLPEITKSPLIMLFLESEPAVIVFLAVYSSDLFRKYSRLLLLATLITAIGVVASSFFLPVKIGLEDVCHLLHLKCSRTCMRTYTLYTIFGRVEILDICHCPHLR